jgi:hypothetical protein
MLLLGRLIRVVDSFSFYGSREKKKGTALRDEGVSFADTVQGLCLERLICTYRSCFVRKTRRCFGAED